jgi:hypothetical protein
MTSVNISFLGVFGGPKSVDLVVGLGGDLVEAIQTVYDETFNSKHLAGIWREFNYYSMYPQRAGEGGAGLCNM